MSSRSRSALATMASPGLPPSGSANPAAARLTRLARRRLDHADVGGRGDAPKDQLDVIHRRHLAVAAHAPAAARRNAPGSDSVNDPIEASTSVRSECS